jgi:putative heme-binding domain-containing protein
VNATRHPASAVLRTVAKRIALILAVFVVVAVPAPAQRDAKVPDPDPELERRSFQVAGGFEVNLFAADPLLAKPIQMNFDPAGRLWVASSEVYPQIQPGQKANDKILVLEDTKGEGKADRVTVFADGLLIPTGVEPGDGGAYVADSTDLLHLADTKGTGKADRRRVVLSGFGTEDTHHILHTFRWGPDGLLYFNQSTYIHSHLETPYGVRRLNGGGVWQFRPETMQLEVFARGFINPWGTSFDRWGATFETDGANGEGITPLIPGASYSWAVGASRILNGLNPGSPKHCGLEILSGRHLPPDWQGNLLTNDFRGHRVCRFVVSEDGSGYASREQPELIKTAHAAFRPIDIKMGPDGAVYIADWYNPIIQHGEVDFRDPRRDHTHGRIWRVTARGRPLVPRPHLVGASTEALLEALKAPEDWTRQQAKRVLKERGAKKVQPELEAWVARLTPPAEHDLLEALWTYQSLDVVEPKLLATLLGAKDHHVRAAAARVAGYWHDRLTNPLELLAARVNDEHPQVRLEAVRALAKVSGPRAVEAATQALDRPMDRWLDYSLWLTVRELEPSWLPALQEGRLTFGGNVRHLLFALQAADSRSTLPSVVGLIRSGKLGKDQEESILTLLAGIGGPPELELVLARILDGDAAAAGQRANLLAALEQATRQRNVRPAGDLARIGKLFAVDNEPVRTGALRLAGLWQVQALRPKLLDLAKDARTAEAVRRAAVEGLAGLGGPASKEALTQLSGPETPPGVRLQAVTGLAALDLDTAAGKAVELLAAVPAGTDPTPVYAAFVQRKNGGAALAKALANKKLPADVAKLGVRAVRATGRDYPALVEALTKAGGLTAGLRVLGPEEMKQMVADVARLGDPARGEAVFRRKDQACLKCHAIAGAGGQVGPDLVSIGASAQVDYLIDSILLPNKAVKEGYHTVVVTTTKGTLVSGIKVRETKTELILRDAEDREVTVPLKDIDETKTGASLMPEGLADSLTRGELLDLVRFLSELGKVGPYSVSKARLARRWQVLEATDAARNLLRTAPSAAAGGAGLTWAPAYSTVAGLLPSESVPRLAWDRGSGQGMTAVGAARCQLDVTTPGKVRLLLNSAKGVSAFVDGKAVEAKAELVLDLATGRHTVTLVVDLEQRREGLRVELEDVPGSAARAALVGGK